MNENQIELERKRELFSNENEYAMLDGREKKADIGKRPKPQLYKCGLSRVDYMTGGFKRGELVVIGGLTGQGKTVLCQTLVKKLTEQNKYDQVFSTLPAAFFSFEVCVDDLFDRFEDGFCTFTLPNNILDGGDFGILEWLDDRILEAKLKWQTNFVFIDHLHFLISLKTLAEARSTSLAIGDIMRKLKKIAMKNKVVIFVVSHTKKKPLNTELCIDDLRDSSFIGQEADIVMLIWRDKDDSDVFTDTATLKIDKNRRLGRLGLCPLKFNKGYFEEIPEREWIK